MMIKPQLKRLNPLNIFNYELLKAFLKNEN